jgi:hypothetical protein
MTQLPEGKSKTAERVRIIINRTGDVWTTWYKVYDDGTLWIDYNGYGQYKKGEWRYIIEREVKTITYEEMGE